MKKCSLLTSTHHLHLHSNSQGLRNRGNEEAKKLISGYKSREWDRNRGAIMQLRKMHEENEEKYNEQNKIWQAMFQEDEEDF